jgi:Sensors of blue-light using FAD
MTYQIVYSSDATTPMQAEDLEDILQYARKNNAEKGITGALVYIDGVFLQVLEGDATELATLMAKISKDVRHETVSVLQEGEVPAALFGEWEMAYLSATPQQIAKWAGLPGATELNDVLDDMGQDAAKVALVTQRILATLSDDEGLPITRQ